MNKIIKLKYNSIRIAIVVFALLLLSLGINGLGILELPSNLNYIALTLGAITIIFIEVGVVSIFSKKKEKPGLDIFSLIGVISAIILGLVVILGLFGLSYTALDSISGLALIVVGISFIIESFAR